MHIQVHYMTVQYYTPPKDHYIHLASRFYNCLFIKSNKHNESSTLRSTFRRKILSTNRVINIIMYIHFNAL